MTDAILVAIVLVFFALCFGYVRLCDRIIGSDETADASDGAIQEAVR